MKEVDEKRVRETICIMKPNGKLFEVRILQGKRTLSGYFKDPDTLIEAMKDMSFRKAEVYITLNGIDEGCYARSQKDVLEIPEVTTSDNDIIGYDFLLVDLDPVRPAKVSSTAAELEKAKQMAERIHVFLKNRGWNDPMIAMSGNGYHLLYKIALQKTKENELLVQNVLKALDTQFSDDDVKVDTANFNPSRICKLYGTLAQKGTGTEDRPHRMSYIISHGSTEQTRRSYLEALAHDLLPEPQRPERYNNYSPRSFDIEKWMMEHSIRWGKKKTAPDYTKYILDECPFDSNHKAPDSCITIGTNGAIGFHCFHNSCQSRTWKDVRLKFEPDAYNNSGDDLRIEEGWKQHKLHNRDKQLPIYEASEEVLEDEPQASDQPVFLTARMILDRKVETEDFIKTGIEAIDNRMRGLKKGSLSLVTGLRGGSKSTLLSQIILQALNDGHNVICYSGEPTAKNFMRWMNLQAAGKNYVKPTQWDGYFMVEQDTQRKIADWMGDKFLLYNNEMGNKYSWISQRIERQIVEQKTDLVVLDNLMALNIRDLNPHDKYDAQTVFVNTLKSLCVRTDIHLIFVAHPRKARQFLRFDDVSGTADLGNMVDNAFIVHRNNEDFRRLSKEMFRWNDDNPIYRGTNVIEIAKDRDGGTQDLFVPLWYEKETKRLKNSEAEYKHYKWEPEDQWCDADELPDEIPF